MSAQPATSILEEPTRDGASRKPSGLTAALILLAGGLAFGFGVHGAGPFALPLIAGAVVCAILWALMVLSGTARRQAASEASYRAFFDHAAEGFFRTTPDGRYLTVNQALADIYGYATPQELIGALTDIGAQLYANPERRGEFRALIQAQDVVTDFISEIRHRSGRRIWISETARAVRDASGMLVCYEGTVEDATEKFEQEQALRAALRQAEIANRMKAAFLAAMSHELKTPLNAVLGFSEIIRDEVLGPVGQEAYRDYASDIHKSGSRLLTVINDVLDVSRLEGGLLTIEVRPQNMLDLAESAVKLARAVTHDARKIEIDLPVDMPLLKVDPRRIAQVLGNLLANALKFTPENGTVRLAARILSDGGAHLVVEDTGIGMADETMAAALEPFRQLDGRLARCFEGAGLGLSIAKALVELHGGALSLKSALGEGTTVTIALPPGCVERSLSAKVA